MGTRGQRIPGQPEPRAVAVPVPCLPAAPPALPMSPRLRPYKVGTDPRGRPVCAVNPAALPLLTVNTSTAPARPLSPQLGDRLTPSPCALDGDPRGPLAVPNRVTRRGGRCKSRIPLRRGKDAAPTAAGMGLVPCRCVPDSAARDTWAQRVLVPARRHRHRAARRQPAFSPKWFLSSPQTKTLFILNQWAITGKWQRSPRALPRRPGGRHPAQGGTRGWHNRGHGGLGWGGRRGWALSPRGPRGHSRCPWPRLGCPGGAPAERLFPSRS